MFKNRLKKNFIYIILYNFRAAIVDCWHKTKKDKKNYVFFIKFFIIRFLFTYSLIRNFIGFNKNTTDIRGVYLNSKVFSNQIINDLVNKGFSGTYRLKKDSIQDIKSNILYNLKVNNIIGNKKNNLLLSDLNFKSFEEIEIFVIKNNIYQLQCGLNLKENNFLKNFFSQDFLISIAKSYLNTNKITINIEVYFSNSLENLSNNSENIADYISASAQKYHFDVDYSKFFKKFIYLSDCNSKDSGAHIYISGTHKSKKFIHQMSKRYDDTEIERTYKNKEIFCGPEGTTFFEDTFGLHKGFPVLKNFRTILIIEYGRGHIENIPNSIFIN
jgi:hypothetical protein